MEENRMYEQKDVEAQKVYDYAQSANSLFHFMKEYRFLKEILLHRAIVPRFYVEDMEYLDLDLRGHHFQEIAVLQKCFCDIPFHQISNIARTDRFDKEKRIQEQKDQQDYYCHTDIYGEYGIAFSKEWAESHDVQPVHYINEKTGFCRNFTQAIQLAFEADELDEGIADSFLQQLAFMKPLKGWMPVKDGYVYKNFHDEREWRYVPEKGQEEIDPVIANPNICSTRGQLDWMSDSLKQSVYQDLWLRYEYDDIAYLIVPDNFARQQLIETIMEIPKEMFQSPEEESSALRQRLTLVSKIVVLDQIRKDF